MSDFMGFIYVHRSLLTNPLWLIKPFSKGQAWVDLCLFANHRDNEFMLGHTLAKAKRGEFITSEVKLAERWGWSRQKVRNYLELLQKTLRMIVVKKDTKKTVIKIVKYDTYQNIENIKKAQKSHKKDSGKTPQKHQKDTNNKDNKVINLFHKLITEEFSQNLDLEPLFLKWFEYKKARGETYKSDLSIKALVNKLVNLSGGDFKKADELIENAMANNWQGIFPLKNSAQQLKTFELSGGKAVPSVEETQKMLEEKERHKKEYEGFNPLLNIKTREDALAYLRTMSYGKKTKFQLKIMETFSISEEELS